MKNLLLCLIAMVAIAACTVEKTMESESSMLLKTRSVASLEVDAQFLKLEDDTASFVAGELEIEAPGNEVAVKWNVFPECNLDTAAVSLPVENGKAHLTIKWNNCLRSHHHGPDNLAFEAGVIISTEDKAKYVRLLWADAIDSLYFAQNPVVMDTPQSPYPEPKVFMVTPLVLNLQEVIGGSIIVSSGDRSPSKVDFSEISTDMNINMDGIIPDPYAPGFVKDGNFLVFEWTAAGPPLFSFTVPIYIENKSKITTAYITYKHKDVPPPFFQILSALPDDKGYISAKDGYFIVVVETNKAWSIVSDHSDEVVEDTDQSDLKTRTKIIHILDNPNPDPRLVKVIIKSQGVPKDTVEAFQYGTEPLINLGYLRDNMPRPLPSEGGEYTFTFTGVNQGTVQVQALVDGVPISVGTAVIGLEAKVTVPENPNTTDRNVTFQYKVTNGEWIPLLAQTNRVQLGTNGGEVDALTYVDSNLPAGNIPQLGDTYTFNFKGTYKGRLRIRASVNGTWYTGDMSSTLSASVNIPANNTPNVLPVKFQYRAFDAVPSQWIYLPDETKRNQDAKTITGTVTPDALTPNTDVSEWGTTYSCTFTGDFTGDIIMRAVTGENEELVRNTGKVNGKISVAVPQLNGANRKVTFQYSIDGGATWNDLGTKQQINETLSFTQISPSGDIPVEGGTYTVTLVGTYSRTVTIRAREGSSSGPIVVEETSKLDKVNANGEHFHEFKLVIPRNTTGSARAIGFSYKREDLANERGMLIKQQNYK